MRFVILICILLVAFRAYAGQMSADPALRTTTIQAERKNGHRHNPQALAQRPVKHAFSGPSKSLEVTYQNKKKLAKAWVGESMATASVPVLHFVVSPQGKLVNSEILLGSADAERDQKALRKLSAVFPLEAMPEDTNAKDADIFLTPRDSRRSLSFPTREALLADEKAYTAAHLSECGQPVPTWVLRFTATVRRNWDKPVNVPSGLKASYQTQVHAPTGTILWSQMTYPSGNSQFDDSTRAAMEKMKGRRLGSVSDCIVSDITPAGFTF